MWTILWEHLSQPDYLHVLLNPVPVYGLAMGTLALLLALALRSRPAQVVALTLVCLSGLAAWPVFVCGQLAFDGVYVMSDPEGQAWLNAHAHRAAKLIWLFYGLAGLSLAAITVPAKWPRSRLPLAVLTLLLAVNTLAAGAWIAYAGGKIRHSEFRRADEPPPP